MLQFQSGSLDLHKVCITIFDNFGPYGQLRAVWDFFSNYELLPTFGGRIFHVFMDKNIFFQTKKLDNIKVRKTKPSLGSTRECQKLLQMDRE